MKSRDAGFKRGVIGHSQWTKRLLVGLYSDDDHYVTQWVALVIFFGTFIFCVQCPTELTFWFLNCLGCRSKVKAFLKVHRNITHFHILATYLMTLERNSGTFYKGVRRFLFLTCEILNENCNSVFVFLSTGRKEHGLTESFAATLCCSADVLLF